MYEGEEEDIGKPVHEGNKSSSTHRQTSTPPRSSRRSSPSPDPMDLLNNTTESCLVPDGSSTNILRGRIDKRRKAIGATVSKSHQPKLEKSSSVETIEDAASFDLDDHRQANSQLSKPPTNTKVGQLVQVYENRSKISAPKRQNLPVIDFFKVTEKNGPLKAPSSIKASMKPKSGVSALHQLRLSERHEHLIRLQSRLVRSKTRL